jgi:sulfoxide reductase heme-binding subunit YedZ
MRAMGGKNWARLHKLVYVAGVAGCVHYWWLVKKGVLLPLPFTVVLGVLLGARVWWSVRKRRTVVSGQL